MVVVLSPKTVKKIFYLLLVVLAFFLFFLALRTHELQNSNRLIKAVSDGKVDLYSEELKKLTEETRARVAIYEDLMERRHLVSGMVVNRVLGKGKSYTDECDSLLFSSLRFVALLKLGYSGEAQKAWESIRKSKNGKRWLRHPLCNLSTSRDMLIGLIVALSQRPQGAKEELSSLLEQINNDGGYFGPGPIYLSYVTPGLGLLLNALASLMDVKVPAKTLSLKEPFSTLELDAVFAPRGYSAHTLGLQIWAEIELAQTFQNELKDPFKPYSFTSDLDFFIKYFAAQSLYEQRLLWASARLFALDPKNLFFRWLRLKTSGNYNLYWQTVLLKDLLATKAFPKERLPKDCDRAADYLWQRDSNEILPKKRCHTEYAGVDFLWMAAMLLQH